MPRITTRSRVNKNNVSHLPCRIHGEWEFKEVIVASAPGEMLALLLEVDCAHNLYTDDLSLQLLFLMIGKGASCKIRNDNHYINFTDGLTF